MATDSTPISLQARMMRSAISPRLATRIRANMEGPSIGEAGGVAQALPTAHPALEVHPGPVAGVLHLAVGEGFPRPVAPDRVHQPGPLGLGLEVVEAQRVAELVGERRRIPRVVQHDVAVLETDPDQVVLRLDPRKALLDRHPVAVAEEVDVQSARLVLAEQL